MTGHTGARAHPQTNDAMSEPHAATVTEAALAYAQAKSEEAHARDGKQEAERAFVATVSPRQPDTHGCELESTNEDRSQVAARTYLALIHARRYADAGDVARAAGELLDAEARATWDVRARHTDTLTAREAARASGMRTST